MKNLYYLLASISVFLSSCIKIIDGPLAVSSSNYDKIEISLKSSSTSDYNQKVYYNLDSKSVVKTSDAFGWDIAFATNPTTNKPNIIMNYAFGVGCNGFSVENASIDSIKNINIFFNNKTYYANHYDDFANLFQDYFAYPSKSFIYYLSFYNGSMYRFRIVDYTATQVKIEYAALSSPTVIQATIPLVSTQNYTYYSLATQSVANIEPTDNTTWDIEFTKYTTLVTQFDTTEMYGVTGVLFNPKQGIQSAYIDNTTIDKISLTNATAATYSNAINNIGYDWKSFSSASSDGFYTINLEFI